MSNVVSRRKPTRRSVLVSVSLLCILAVVLYAGVLAARAIRGSASIDTAAAVLSYRLDSAQGRDLLRQYESLNREKATRDNGPAVFLTGAWTITGNTGRHCQIQLAVHHGGGWQLFGWTSDQHITNGTINSWGTIVADVRDLATYQDTITLPLTGSGRFMLIWSTPAYSTEVDGVRARTIYACGDADQHPRIADVKMSYGH